MTVCPWCETGFVDDEIRPGKRRRFCTDSCKNNFYVSQARRRIKEKAVAHMGGKCSRCNYSKCIAALVFHHVDGKDFGIAKSGRTRGWEHVKRELKRCILVCSNCHAEIHDEERSEPLAPM